MNQEFLKIKDLSCSYEKGFELKNISCNFYRGELYGIIGPNGSGKTTLIKAATGLMKRKSGKIEIEGKEISYLSPSHIAQKIAVVMQENNPLLEMNVLDYVLLGRIPYRKSFSFIPNKDDIKIAEEMLSKCGIANFANRNISELSGGERQLVHIAKALAQKPQIIFLDEPTNHLDLAHQYQIMNLLKSLTEKEFICIIVVIHDLNLAGRFCKKLCLMNHGELILTGKPEEILNPKILEQIYQVKIAIQTDNINQKPLVFTPL